MCCNSICSKLFCFVYYRKIYDNIGRPSGFGCAITKNSTQFANYLHAVYCFLFRAKRLHKLSLKGYALCNNKTGIKRNNVILGKKKATRIRMDEQSIWKNWKEFLTIPWKYLRKIYVKGNRFEPSIEYFVWTLWSRFSSQPPFWYNETVAPLLHPLLRPPKYEKMHIPSIRAFH